MKTLNSFRLYSSDINLLIRSISSNLPQSWSRCNDSTEEKNLESCFGHFKWLRTNIWRRNFFRKTAEIFFPVVRRLGRDAVGAVFGRNRRSFVLGQELKHYWTVSNPRDRNKNFSLKNFLGQSSRRPVNLNIYALWFLPS